MFATLCSSVPGGHLALTFLVLSYFYHLDIRGFLEVIPAHSVHFGLNTCLVTCPCCSCCSICPCPYCCTDQNHHDSVHIQVMVTCLRSSCLTCPLGLGTCGQGEVVSFLALAGCLATYCRAGRGGEPCQEDLEAKAFRSFLAWRWVGQTLES